MEKTLCYADILLKPIPPQEALSIPAGDACLPIDRFDRVLSLGKDLLLYGIFKASEKAGLLGVVSLYDLSEDGRTASIYGKIGRLSDYGTLIKGFLALFSYAFSTLGLKKLTLVCREDNDLLGDVCLSLGLVSEGLLRGQFFPNPEKDPFASGDEAISLKVYGLLDYEYRRLAAAEYRKLFAWDYGFDPQNALPLDWSPLFNRRIFTDSLSNPNGARINDWLSEFAMNRERPESGLLTYKAVGFPVKIFDPDAIYDCLSCEKQEISLPAGRYSDLLLVATAQFGGKELLLTAVYDDGSREECGFYVGDWCDRLVRTGYVLHTAAACRYLGANSNLIKGDAFLYLVRVKTDPCRRLFRLILPDNPDVFLFAGALCPAGNSFDESGRQKAEPE